MLIDEYGRLLLNVDSKKRTWYDYVLKLFEDNCRSVTFASWNTSGSPLLMSEIMHALKLAKISKAMGPDMVSVEVLKLLEEDFMNALTKFFQQIYDSGEIPEDWLLSSFMTIPKKGNPRKCSECRKFRLKSHVTKMFLSIIQWDTT